MISDIDVPLEVALLACAIFAGAGIWSGRLRGVRGFGPHRAPGGPTGQAYRPDGTTPLAFHRDRARRNAHAVLHARIGQPEAAGAAWTPEMRQQMLDHISAVMRAGLRRDDTVFQAGPDAITITVPGADERAAIRIARRLRDTLARFPFPDLARGTPVTAHFGVAAAGRSAGIGAAGLRARRAAYVAVARAERDDHIVAASDIEDVICLPPPHASGAASAA